MSRSISLIFSNAYFCSFFAFIQVARLPKFKQLSRELLLDIIEVLADERSEARTCQDMTNDNF
jgi:hypothetical protein